MLVELLEKAFVEYEKQQKKENQPQPIYSLAPDLDELNQYPTYCADCGEATEQEPEFCSFRTETNQEP
ncbi:6369_t:CDS:2, partial [Entrophospora sp. SA101]